MDMKEGYIWVLDANRLVAGPWGECMHSAVEFEINTPGFEQIDGYEEDVA